MLDQVSTWLTRSEAAAYARVSCSTIDRWARDPDIPLTKYTVGGKRSVRFKRDEIDAVMKSEAVSA
jgi:excisionase family DNA binding protein